MKHADSSPGHTGTILLAYLHRYVYPLSIVPFIVWRQFLLSGMLLILFALWDWGGYLLRWAHIYCSYQNGHHEKMTPENPQWDKLSKSEVSGVSAVFAFLGAGMIIMSFVR